MKTVKVCIPCYTALYPHQRHRRVTLGRQCIHCKKSYVRCEEMVPLEAVDYAKVTA